MSRNFDPRVLMGDACTGSFEGTSGGMVFIDHDEPCPAHLSDYEAICPAGHVYDAVDEGGPCCPYPEEIDMDDMEAAYRDAAAYVDALAAEAAYRKDEDARIDAEIAEAMEAEKALLADEAAMDTEDWVLNLRGGW